MRIVVYYGTRPMPVIAAPEEYIIDIKTVLASMTQIPEDEQVLSYNGIELMNGRTASSYSIQDNDILDLYLRPVQVPCAVCQPPPINVTYDVANGVTYNRRMNHGVIRFSNGLYG